jgi:hypothetical protein
MRILTALFVTLVLSFSATSAWAQQGDRARRLELATRFVDLSMGEELPKMIDQLIEEELVAAPDMPQAERDWIRRNMPALTMAFIDDMAGELGPIYAEAFTLEELEALVGFYEAPMGRSIATKQFAINANSQEVLAGALLRFLQNLETKFCAEFDCGDEPTTVPSGK